MKIAITGKGGVGKTTISALLAHVWAEAGYKVLAIDADPVSSLAGALGFPEPDKIVPLSEMAGLVEERTGAKPGTLGQIFKLNPKVDDLPDKIAHQHNNIKLLVMGGVKTGGSGCVCPESTLIKSLIRHLLLETDERVIMDMEAGVEHLGRSTADAVDWMIIVVEPGMRSIQTAHRIKNLAQQIGVTKIVAIANKVKPALPFPKGSRRDGAGRSENDPHPESIRGVGDRQFILNNLDKIKLIGNIPYSESIGKMDRGEAVNLDASIKEEVKSILNFLENK